jgi:formylglycine-generating enzyme required for sulfatase activity
MRKVFILSGLLILLSSQIFSLPKNGRMVLIPAGTWSDSSGPQIIQSQSYWMDTAEVTQEGYQTVMDTNPSIFNGYNPQYGRDFGIDLQRPVENINWIEALLFCNARSKADSLDSCYRIYYKTGAPQLPDSQYFDSIRCDWQNNGYRLPTRYEWEYAYHAGTPGVLYWGGNAPLRTAQDTLLANANCWWAGNDTSGTKPVGKKFPNPWGLYDMFGNVEEWEWSLSFDLCSKPKVDCKGDDLVTSRNFSMFYQHSAGGRHYGAGFTGEIVHSSENYSNRILMGIRCVRNFMGSGLYQKGTLPGFEYGINVHPNPFNHNVYIAGTASECNFKKLAIYDLRGKQVAGKGNLPFGNNSKNVIQWNGSDFNGRAVPAGVYYVVMNIATNNVVKKVIKY